MKGSQTNAQTHRSSRKAKGREKQILRRGGGEGERLVLLCHSSLALLSGTLP